MKSFLSACVIATAALWCVPQVSQACTTFSVDTPQGPLVAKSFDWSTGDGWVVLNERGRSRTLLFPSATLSGWQAKYASLALTTTGPGFPVSGMNEAGLVIETLVDMSELPTTEVAAGVPTGLELVQMGLDTAGSVKELVELVQRTSFSQLAIALHFFACDRTGACAVIEAQAGRVRTTAGDHLKVEALANRRYAADLADADPSWLEGIFGHTKGSSADRFAIAARATASRTTNAQVLLNSLRDVATPGLTKWQLVWDAAHKQVHLRRPELGPEVMTFQVAKFPSCEGAPRVMRLGDTGGASVPWSAADAARTEAAVLAQLGGSSASAAAGSRSSSPSAFLAARVAQATQSTSCAVTR